MSKSFRGIQTQNSSVYKDTVAYSRSYDTAPSGNHKKLAVAEVSEVRWQVWNLNLERQPEMLSHDRNLESLNHLNTVQSAKPLCQGWSESTLISVPHGEWPRVKRIRCKQNALAEEGRPGAKVPRGSPYASSIHHP